MSHKIIKHGNHKINDDINGYMYNYNVSEGYNFGSHIHKCYEFIYIHEGTMHYTVENSEYVLSKGDIIMTNPLEFHSFSFPEKCTYEREFLHIYPGFLKDYPNLTAALNNRRAGHFNRISSELVSKYKLDFIFRGIEEYCENVVPETDFMVLTYTLQLVSKINQILRCESEEAQSEITGKKANSICRYIDSYYKNDITIEKIAENVYMSPSHASRLFKKETGMTVKAYLTLRRITHAKSLIMQGYKTMSIYSECGFGDYSSFYRAFVKYVGMTPNEFKTLQQNSY